MALEQTTQDALYAPLYGLSVDCVLPSMNLGVDLCPSSLLET